MGERVASCEVHVQDRKKKEDIPRLHNGKMAEPLQRQPWHVPMFQANRRDHLLAPLRITNCVTERCRAYGTMFAKRPRGIVWTSI